MAKLKSLAYLLRNDLHAFSNDNLHRIAISNLSDGDRELKRWWTKKYGKPLKDFEDHTPEELLIEMYEDYYAKNPQEVQAFEDIVTRDDEWDGSMPDDHEFEMKKILDKKGKVDLSKYQTDGDLTEEDEKKILESLGMNLPKSKRVVNMGEGEFDEHFLGDDR
jgi:hypothetical protein